MSTNRIKNYYNDYSSWYEGERRHGYYELINELEFDKIRQAVAGMRVLEIGCGTGLILEKAAKVADSAIGVDLSEGMVEVATGKGLDARHGDATRLDFPDASFDVVYSFKALPHVPNIRAALREITRVVKPEGRLFLEFYNPLSFKNANGLLRRLIGGEKVYCRYDSPKRVLSYLPQGWDIKSTRGVRILAPAGFFYTAPGLGSVFRFLDRELCDSPIRIFGGYMVYEIARADRS